MIVKMQKICIVGHKKEKNKIIKRLASLGAVEITANNNQMLDNIVNEIASLTKKLNRTKAAIDILGKFDDSKKSMFAEKIGMTDEQIFSLEDETYNLVKKINHNYQKMEIDHSKILKLKNEKDKIEPYISSTIPVNQFKSKHIYFETGFFSKDFSESMLLEEISNALITPYFLSRNTESCYYAFAIHKSSLEIFADISKKYGFSKIGQIYGQGKITRIINIYNKQIDNCLIKAQGRTENILADIPKKDQLLRYYDVISARLEIEKAESQLQNTKSTFIINGYIPKSVGDKVKNILTKDFLCAVYLTEVPEDEEFPVKISNSAIIEPYELVTEMYSTPSSKGIDPSAFMAPFYFIFFGMMLSDAGYGLVICILTGIIILKKNPEGFMGKILKLLFMCGVSTMIWGALFGGFFANITEVAFGIVTKPLWFNPMDEPLKLLVVAYMIGFIHIITGMALKAYMLIRDKKVWDAVFDVGSWYIVFIGAICLVSPYTNSFAGYISLFGLAMVVLTQGRHEKGNAKKLITGILSLYDITAYLSDVLSYSRLLALGLATGVIGMVINIMGSLGGKSVVGYIILLVVFVAGHTFNIAINILGSYVHSGRLMYIEFFGKFFESGGKTFNPLSLNCKYTKIMK